MTDTEKVLEVKSVGKSFRKSALPPNSNFREALSHGWRQLFKKEDASGGANTIALRDISFSLEQGDILGIIGRNGAGKSTLLKILAGIHQPSQGEVVYKGRLVSILELGAGFHPDLTGRENIYLNGSLLGLSRREINEKFDAIVSFSDLITFINQPVKYYSNGMYLRLAFSVFTHLSLDILLLDEVMAVGDALFRQKSYNQISALANDGATIMIVSHNPHEIKDLCTKCLWLEEGHIADFGNTVEVVDHYLEKSFLLREELDGSVPGENGSFVVWQDGFDIKGEIRMLKFGIKASERPATEPILLSDPMEITIEFEKLNSRQSIEITICILSFYSTWVFVDSYSLYEALNNRVLRQGRYVCTCTIPAGILNFGVYQLGFLVSREEKLIYQIPGLINFKIGFDLAEGIRENIAKGAASIIRPCGRWKIEEG